MLSYVTRFSFPDDPFVIEDMMGDGNDPTDLESVLMGYDCDWSLPKSAMGGHVVWFQLTSRSLPNAKRALRQAEIEGLDLVALHVRELMPIIESNAGCVIAVGRVTGPPKDLGDQGRHFRGRVFARVEDIHVLAVPVPAVQGVPLTALAAFAPTGPVVNRVFADNIEYDAALEILGEKPNRIPKYAKKHISGPIPTDDTATWIRAIRSTDVGFVVEAQVEGYFADPLLRRISDDGQVRRQVTVRKSGRNPKIADAVAWFGGVPVPVEYKLNASVAEKLSSQLASYSGPADLDCSPKVRTTHPYVILIDAHGARVAKHGDLLEKGPTLRRVDISNEAIAEFKRELTELLA